MNKRFITLLLFFSVSLFIGVLFFMKYQGLFEQEKKSEKQPQEKTENNIDPETGLVVDKGYKIVIQNCISCHSSKLIIQNKATREGWLSMIRWMQETQKLWDLGDDETIILDYLARHYAPSQQGRRKPLSNIEWYVLSEEK